MMNRNGSFYNLFTIYDLIIDLKSLLSATKLNIGIVLTFFALVTLSFIF